MQSVLGIYYIGHHASQRGPHAAVGVTATFCHVCLGADDDNTSKRKKGKKVQEVRVTQPTSHRTHVPSPIGHLALWTSWWSQFWPAFHVPAHMMPWQPGYQDLADHAQFAATTDL